jgi:hypothetical protein
MSGSDTSLAKNPVALTALRKKDLHRAAPTGCPSRTLYFVRALPAGDIVGERRDGRMHGHCRSALPSPPAE